MSEHTTCWTVIHAAAGGSADDRQDFARHYQGLIRAYLRARWEGTPYIQDVDDAVQEVFVERFRAGGVLERVDPKQPGGFRAFFYGVLRNVALRVETRRARQRDRQPATEYLESRSAPDDEQLSRFFDRQWAAAIMREAAERQRRWAAREGGAAQRRVDLLRLRFHDGLPIREIARLWDVPAEQLHRQYARARREFRRQLEAVVGFHHPGAPEAIEAECEQLLTMLG